MRSESALEVALRVPGDGARFRLDVTFTVGLGVTVLAGPSGAGKSTCLLAIAGLVRPSYGRVVLSGRTLLDSAAHVEVAPRARRIALVFQSLALFPHLSVAENVAFGLPRGVARAERGAIVEHWLARMRVAQLAERRPATLSGGEAQRVALARALASAPALLLLDEPFSALDQELRRELALEVAALVGELRIPALLVTHEPESAASYAAEVLRFSGGALIGTSEGATSA